MIDALASHSSHSKSALAVVTSPRATIVFLDRDGTVIRDVHYLAHPDQVELLDGAADAIARLNAEHIPVVLVTNQSGIARGYFTEADYERVHARLVDLLADHSAHFDAAYHCPDHPDVSGPCLCRKPSPMLFRQAIEEHDLDATWPVFVGDRWRDLEPVGELGGQAYLIPSPDTPAADIERATWSDTPIVPSLTIAVDHILDSPVSGLPSASPNL